MNKRILVVVALLAVVGGGVAWALLRPDPALAQLRQMTEQNFDRIREMSDEERREAFRQQREAYEKLDEQQQEQLREEFMQRGMERYERHMDEFFAMTPEEQNAHLDEQIERMENWSQRRQRPEGEGRARPEGPGAGPPGGFRGGRGATLDANQRQQRRVDRLDRTSASFRAKATEYRRRIEERRAELGYPPRSGRGRW